MDVGAAGRERSGTTGYKGRVIGEVMPVTDDRDFEPLAVARGILRCAMSGALATTAADTKAPFASRVIVACDCDGTPLLLLSDLAIHTANLNADPRACLLLGSECAADPMREPRLSVTGRVERDRATACRSRFLARHPSAARYADFKDFSFYRLEVSEAHLVADFGRIHSIPRSELLLPTDIAGAIEDAEPGIIDHMNADHADAISLYATQLLGASEGPWRMSGCDP